MRFVKWDRMKERTYLLDPGRSRHLRTPAHMGRRQITNARRLNDISRRCRWWWWRWWRRHRARQIVPRIRHSSGSASPRCIVVKIVNWRRSRQSSPTGILCFHSFLVSSVSLLSQNKNQTINPNRSYNGEWRFSHLSYHKIVIYTWSVDILSIPDVRDPASIPEGLTSDCDDLTPRNLTSSLPGVNGRGLDSWFQLFLFKLPSLSTFNEVCFVSSRLVEDFEDFSYSPGNLTFNGSVITDEVPPKRPQVREKWKLRWFGWFLLKTTRRIQFRKAQWQRYDDLCIGMLFYCFIVSSHCPQK